LLPLGLSDDESMFDNQAEHITKLLKSIIAAGKAMRLIKE
jgi:hypothetical protein